MESDRPCKFLIEIKVAGDGVIYFHKMKHFLAGASVARSDLASPERLHRVALSVMRSKGEVALCPFFGKCDGVLIIDACEKSREFYTNEQRTAAAICELILNTGADRLICGFVGEPERQRLGAAGIDVRLGSCACAVEDLVACFDDLPRA